MGLGVVGVDIAHAVMPMHEWTTVGHMSFFHRSNTSGPFADAAIGVMSKFQMVTIEKWQGIDVPGGNETMEKNIVGELKRVKDVNASVSTIFYYNSVCDFPQYDELYSQYVAMPEHWLRDASGATVFQSCAGFDNSSYPSGMPVYNHADTVARDLWISECVNATNTGVVDGCFVDRAVDTQGCVRVGARAWVRVGGRRQKTSSPVHRSQCRLECPAASSILLCCVLSTWLSKAKLP